MAEAWQIMQTRRVVKDMLKESNCVMLTTLSEVSGQEKVDLAAVEKNFDVLSNLIRRCPFKPPLQAFIVEAIYEGFALLPADLQVLVSRKRAEDEAQKLHMLWNYSWENFNRSLYSRNVKLQRLKFLFSACPESCTSLHALDEMVGGDPIELDDESAEDEVDKRYPDFDVKRVDGDLDDEDGDLEDEEDEEDEEDLDGLGLLSSPRGTEKEADNDDGNRQGSGPDEGEDGTLEDTVLEMEDTVLEQCFDSEGRNVHEMPAGFYNCPAGIKGRNVQIARLARLDGPPRPIASGMPLPPAGATEDRLVFSGPPYADKFGVADLDAQLLDVALPHPAAHRQEVRAKKRAKLQEDEPEGAAEEGASSSKKPRVREPRLVAKHKSEHGKEFVQVLLLKPGDSPKSVICINPNKLGVQMSFCKILADRLMRSMSLTEESLEKLKKDAQTMLRQFMEEYAAEALVAD